MGWIAEIPDMEFLYSASSLLFPQQIKDYNNREFLKGECNTHEEDRLDRNGTHGASHGP